MNREDRDRGTGVRLTERTRKLIHVVDVNKHRKYFGF